jgi:hypothetical protein
MQTLNFCTYVYINEIMRMPNFKIHKIDKIGTLIVGVDQQYNTLERWGVPVEELK